MLYASFFQHARKQLAFFYRNGTYQDGAPALVYLNDLIHHSPHLTVYGREYNVVFIFADHRLMRRNTHDIQPVDSLEFLFLCFGRARHTAKLFVHAEIILERDGRQRLAFILHLHAFFGLNRLVQALAVPAPDHQSSGKLVYDDNLPFLHNIVHIALKQHMGLQCLVDMVVELRVVYVGKVVHMERLLGLAHPFFRQRYRLHLFIHGIVVFCF